MMCEHSLWSNNPAELTCEGNHTSSFAKAKSLQVKTILGWSMTNLIDTRILGRYVPLILGPAGGLGLRPNQLLASLAWGGTNISQTDRRTD